MNATLLDLETSDRVRISARRWPVTGSPSGIGVVVVHGFGATGSEERVVAVAEALTGQGHKVLTYDSRGHGDSGGEATLGDAEALDVAAAVEAMPTERIVVVGASMGAIGALRYAVAHAESSSLAGVVTVSCPARWTLPRNARGVLSALMTQTPLGRWGARRYARVRIAKPGRRPAPPIELVPELHAPLAIVHGAADPFIAVAEARALHGAARDPCRLDVISGLGHAFEAPSIAPVVEAVNWVLADRP